MQKAISPSVAFVMIIVVIFGSSVALYFWASSLREPNINDRELQISINPINSTALRVINVDTENSSSFSHLSTSKGNCEFSSSTVLQPGISEICTLSNPVANGTTLTVYADGLESVKVKF